jgi:type I restriction enzyme, S subunit
MRKTYKLREIAPPVPAASEPHGERVWLLNLDQIEPQTGALLGRSLVRREDVGTSTHAFDERNVLYSKLRPYLNKVYLPDAPGFCTSELVPMRPDSNLITRKYLAYYLRSSSFLRWVNQQIDGAKMPRVSMKVFWDHEVDLPEPDEQERITTILDKAVSLHRRRQEAIGLTDAFLRASYLALASKQEDRITVERLLADVPNAARTGPFGSQLLVSEFEESGVPVLGIDNVVQNRFSWGARRFISEEKYKALERYTVRPGDVMVTIMGTTGRVAIAPEDLPTCISTKHLCTLTLDRSQVLPEYLWACLRWDPEVEAQTQREAKGAIMEGWNMGIVKGLEIRRPPLQQQSRFAEQVSAIRRFQSHAGQSLDRVHELSDSLASQFFNQ